jgi:CelD/BcsL family acetyltransferase involved in cellulose biosynthesis
MSSLTQPKDYHVKTVGTMERLDYISKRDFAAQSVTAAVPRVTVEVVPASGMSDDIRQAWIKLRAQNPDLWSPYFDIRLCDVLAEHAPNAQLAVISEGSEIKALFPFQGRRGGLTRPLGAPMSDQHDLIAAKGTQFDLTQIIAWIKMSGFLFCGLLRKVPAALKSTQSQCHVADLSAGLDSYVAWRKTNWNDQVKKNERRKRQGERDWGPMRIVTTCPKTSNAFETLMAWKQAKYIETNRHNVLAVPWINAVLRDLYHSSDPDFAGEITALYFGEHLAALEFGLRAGSAMHSWFPAYDHAFSKVSPGILLMDGMIEACATRGITKVDLGIGHDQYKRHASNAPVPVWSGTLPISPLRRLGTQGFVAVSNWAHKVLPQRYGETLGKLERRHEMILAAEPTPSGRLSGYLKALKAVRF